MAVDLDIELAMQMALICENISILLNILMLIIFVYQLMKQQRHRKDTNSNPMIGDINQSTVNWTLILIPQLTSTAE